MPSLLPKVLILGRPNVGKSTLFNRLLGQRMAIVHDQPGVTRDCLTAEVANKYLLVDSGGIFGEKSEFSDQIVQRLASEIRDSKVLLWVVDGQQGVTPADRTVANLLRAHKERVLVVVNKVDSVKQEWVSAEFYALGFDTLVCVSAEHNQNISELLSVVEKFLPDLKEGPVNTEPRIKIAIIGRPNVGKSSLVNALLKEERMLVSNIAGTTRDAVECDFDWQMEPGKNIKFSLVDTAGLRKRYTDPVDYFCSVRTHEAIEKANVVLLLLDPFEGVTEIDKSLANLAFEKGKGCLWAITKWDLVEKTFHEQPLEGFKNIHDFQTKFSEAVTQNMSFLPNIPLCFTSSETQKGFRSLLSAAYGVYNRNFTQIPTPKLNQWMEKAFEKQSPPSCNGKFFKAYYMVQSGTAPISLKIFCNRTQWLLAPYKRFLEKSFREHFQLEGCPVVWNWIEKSNESRFLGNR